MFIDFLTLMLLNLVVGLVLLALFAYKYLNENRKVMIPGFLITGFIGTVTGFYMIFTWPLAGSNNIAFGEPSLLFGVLFLAAALSIIKDWELLTVTIFAFFAGAATIILGIGIVANNMTKSPWLTALGFFIAGGAGIGALPLYLLRKIKIIRILAALFLLFGAGIWSITAIGAYYDHMASFKDWKPATMLQAKPQPPQATPSPDSTKVEQK